MWHLNSKCSLSDGAIELTTRALSVSSVRERCLGVRFLLVFGFCCSQQSFLTYTAL